jgi:hypothetical protein
MSVWFGLLLIVLFVGGILFAISKVTRPKTPVLSKLSAPCPVCADKKIYQTGASLECASCHSVLKVTVNSRVLLVIPILLGFCAAMFLTRLLETSGILSGLSLAMVQGAVASVGFGFTLNAGIRGLSYRVANP